MAQGNGRYGGGSAGAEHRYHFPALDSARWDDANVGKTVTDPRWGGSAGQVIGSYVNTTQAPRGKIMGATIHTCWPNNGFLMGLPK